MKIGRGRGEACPRSVGCKDSSFLAFQGFCSAEGMDEDDEGGVMDRKDAVGALSCDVEEILSQAEGFLTEQKWDEAKERCGQVISKDENDVRANLYLLMANNQVSEIDDLATLSCFITDFDEYIPIDEYGDNALKKRLRALNDVILDRKLKEMKACLEAEDFVGARAIAEYILDYYPLDSEDESYKDDVYRAVLLIRTKYPTMEELAEGYFLLSEYDGYDAFSYDYTEKFTAEVKDVEWRIRKRILKNAEDECRKTVVRRTETGKLYVGHNGNTSYIERLADEKYFKNAVGEKDLPEEEREYIKRVAICKFFTDAEISSASELKYYDKTHNYKKYEELPSYELYLQFASEEEVELAKRYAAEIAARMPIIDKWEEALGKKCSEKTIELGGMYDESETIRAELRALRIERDPLSLSIMRRAYSPSSEQCRALCPHAILNLVALAAFIVIASQLSTGYSLIKTAVPSAVIFVCAVVRLIFGIRIMRQGKVDIVQVFMPVLTVSLRIFLNITMTKEAKQKIKDEDREYARIQDRIKVREADKDSLEEKIMARQSEQRKLVYLYRGKRYCSEAYKTRLYAEAQKAADPTYTPKSEAEILEEDLYAEMIVPEAKKYVEIDE